MPIALIVEDEPQANQLLAMIVQLRGYQTSAAFTGDEALAKVADQQLDVIFLDLMLPDTNGFEVCKTLRSRPGTMTTPIIMVTARLADENRLKSYEVGANEFVPKPYTPNQIFDALVSVDAWRRDLEENSGTGEIRLDARRSETMAQEILRFRSLLITRHAISGESAEEFVVSLDQLCQEGREWGERKRKDLVATLSYEIEDDCVRVRIRDNSNSGWIESGDFAANDALKLLALRQGFQRTPSRDASGEVTLIKRLPKL